MPQRKVLLVGHCGVDGPMLQDVLGKALDVPIERINDSDRLGDEASRDAVLLVNRELVGDFGTESGIELIQRLAQNGDAPTMMLVSDREDAQEEAVKAGAKPGFGKAQASAPETAELVKRTLGAA
jgi:hypothetical protein